MESPISGPPEDILHAIIYLHHIPLMWKATKGGECLLSQQATPFQVHYLCDC